jgi:hypothetical protein
MLVFLHTPVLTNLSIIVRSLLLVKLIGFLLQEWGNKLHADYFPRGEQTSRPKGNKLPVDKWRFPHRSIENS